MKYRFLKKITLICASISCLPAYAAALDMTNLVFGAVSKSDDRSWRPVILKEETPNQWVNLPASSKLNPNFLYSKAGCHQGTCFMAGAAWSAKSLPFIAVSQDAGYSWQRGNVTYDKQSYSNTLNQLACSHERCVAGGWSQTNKPLFVTATAADHYKTWKPVKLNFTITNPEPSVYNLTCSGTICSALIDTPKKLITSKDNGLTWDLASIAQLYKKPALSKIVCQSKTCFAMGTDETLSVPVILKSVNNGASWVNLTDIAIPANVSNSMLYDASCNDKMCVTGGAALTSGSREAVPFLLIGSNQGETWAPVNMRATLPLSKTQLVSQLTCSDTACFAVVQTLTNQIKTVLEIKRADQGGIAMHKTLPIKSFDNAHIVSLHCEHNECKILGYYDKEEKQTLLFLVSHDGGATWSAVKKVKGLEEFAQVRLDGEAVTL